MPKLIEREAAVAAVKAAWQQLRLKQSEEWEHPAWHTEGHYSYSLDSDDVSDAFQALGEQIAALPDATPCRGCAYAYKPYAQLAVERAEEDMR